jgi:hypothetical protein
VRFICLRQQGTFISFVLRFRAPRESETQRKYRSAEG